MADWKRNEPAENDFGSPMTPSRCSSNAPASRGGQSETVRTGRRGFSLRAAGVLQRFTIIHISFPTAAVTPRFPSQSSAINHEKRRGLTRNLPSRSKSLQKRKFKRKIANNSPAGPNWQKQRGHVAPKKTRNIPASVKEGQKNFCLVINGDKNTHINTQITRQGRVWERAGLALAFAWTYPTILKL